MLAAVLTILFLLAIRLAWGWHAHRAFESAIAEIRQRGEPIEPEDFDSAVIPDEENAVAFLLKAMDALSLTPEEHEFIGVAFASPIRRFEGGVWTAVEDDIARRIESKNAETLRLLRAARWAPRAEWGQRVRSPSINYFFPSFSEHRQLLKLLDTLALAESHRGEFHAAFQYVLDMLAHAEHLHNEPTLIGHLVAIAELNTVMSRIEDMTPLIRRIEAAESATTEEPRGPRRRDLEELLRRMIDESRYLKVGPNRMRFERMLNMDMARNLFSGELAILPLATGAGSAALDWVEYASTWPVLPVFLVDGERVIHTMTGYVEALRSPTWPVAARWFPSENAEPTWWERATRPINRGLETIGGLHYFAKLHYEALAYRRLAATVLAIHLFREDHGHRPETLDELVPKYLATVPQDPLAEGDKPLRYLPDADPPIVYSVGQDGTDSGGRYRGDDGTVNVRKWDLVFMLDGWPAQQEPENKTPNESAGVARPDDGARIRDDPDKADNNESGQAAQHEDRVEDQQADPGDAQDENQRPQ